MFEFISDECLRISNPSLASGHRVNGSDVSSPMSQMMQLVSAKIPRFGKNFHMQILFIIISYPINLNDWEQWLKE